MPTTVHDGDSSGYAQRDCAWLTEHVPGLPTLAFTEVRHYAGSVRIAGDLVCEGSPSTCVVVDGDLEVDGDVYFCGDALVVRGEVRCSVFESWSSAFVIAKAIRARRSIAFTTPVGTDHAVEVFEAPILICSELDDLFGNGVARRIGHIVDFADAPDGVGDAMVLELVRTRTDDVLGRLEAGEPIWSLIPIPTSLPLRLGKIVDAVHAGATFEWTELSGKPAVRLLAVDGTRQMAVLNPDEHTLLRVLLSKC